MFDKAILVTGGTGFIGSQIVKDLLKSGFDAIVVPTTDSERSSRLKKVLPNSHSCVRVVEGDIRSFDFVRSLFSLYNFDTIFHLAGISRLGNSEDSVKQLFDINVTGTLNVLEAARLSGDVRAVVVGSSSKVYSSAGLFSGEAPRRCGTYEVSKACADVVAQAYAGNFGVPIAIARCTNVYGFGDTDVHRLIPRTISRIKEGKSPIVWSNVAKTRLDFIHVSDASNAYRCIAENIDKSAGRVYDVGSGEKYTVEEIVRFILKLLGSTMEPVYESMGMPDDNEIRTDLAKIQSELNWVAKVKFKKGIMDVLRG